MKTIISSLFLLLSFTSKSQTSDVLYDFHSKSLIVSYRGFNSFGFYLGGKLKSEIHEPFVYTTPMALINKGGLNITYKNRLSIMFGFIREETTYKSEVFLKLNPIRILFKKNDLPDLSFAMGYSRKLNFCIGISIPFRGIY